MLTGCVLVYRYTKERNINELRHNSMYGCENKRNSPVYRYTRTAPAYFSGHSFLTKTRLYFSFKFLGKLYCEIRRRGRLVWTVQWWDGTLVFRIDFALHYHVSEVWKANANATESTWKCFISCVCIFNFVCLSCICIFVGISLHCIFVCITRIFLEADTRPTHLLYYQIIIRIQATGGTEKHSNRT